MVLIDPLHDCGCTVRRDQSSVSVSAATPNLQGDHQTNSYGNFVRGEVFKRHVSVLRFKSQLKPDLLNTSPVTKFPLTICLMVALKGSGLPPTLKQEL